jgi:hypothetical protein
MPSKSPAPAASASKAHAGASTRVALADSVGAIASIVGASGSSELARTVATDVPSTAMTPVPLPTRLMLTVMEILTVSTLMRLGQRIYGMRRKEATLITTICAAR